MRNNHEIDYKIYGEELQFVEIELDPQETVIGEPGGFDGLADGCFQMAFTVDVEPTMINQGNGLHCRKNSLLRGQASTPDESKRLAVRRRDHVDCSSPIDFAIVNAVGNNGYWAIHSPPNQRLGEVTRRCDFVVYGLCMRHHDTPRQT